MNSQLAQEYDLNKFGWKIVKIVTSLKTKYNIQWLKKRTKQLNFISISIFLCTNTKKNKGNFSRVGTYLLI